MFLTAKQIMTPFAAQAKEPGVRYVRNARI